MTPPAFDVVVIGAGAAGLMCAATAGQRGRRVLLLDHAAEPGRKILISGGGRCNFTNTGTVPERFFSANAHFARSALSRYTADDFIALVARHGIATHEKTLGQLFCDGSARAIVAMLLAECAAAGVELRTGHRVTALGRSDRFSVETDHGCFTAGSLVLATGGLSIPKLGATGFAHDAARRFGLALTTLRPALVPLLADEDDLALMRPLSGVALPVEARCGRHASARRCCSPIAACPGRRSCRSRLPGAKGESVVAGPAAGHRRLAALRRPRPRTPAPRCGRCWPACCRNAWRTRWRHAGPPAPGQHPGPHAGQVGGQPVGMAGRAGRHRGLCQGGGHARRRRHRRALVAHDGGAGVPGLFVVGEAVDVTGWLGGYNFQWAWSSGWCAGMAA